MTEQEARRRKRQSERDRLLGERRLTYTVPETAVILGIGINQAYEWARAGTLPSVRLGKRFLVPRVGLEKMLAGEASDMRGTKMLDPRVGSGLDRVAQDAAARISSCSRLRSRLLTPALPRWRTRWARSSRRHLPNQAIPDVLASTVDVPTLIPERSGNFRAPACDHLMRENGDHRDG